MTGDPTGPGGWNSAQIGMVERLLPHLRQFVRVRQALASAGALGASLTALLDNAMVGVIHLDRRGVMVEANSRGSVKPGAPRAARSPCRPIATARVRRSQGR